MPITDTRTSPRNYPVPVATNKLKDDVLRLAAALGMVDDEVVALLGLIAGKAALEHEHDMSEIAGLLTALAGKAALNHQHSLNDLAEVSIVGMTANQVLMKVGSLVVPVSLQIGHVANLETLLNSKATPADIADLATTMATALAARMQTASFPGLVSLEGVALGQCRLDYSGGNLVLIPFDGEKLFVNGLFREIPGGGVSLAGAGITTVPIYYIYAYMNGSTMTLEASATGPAVNATYGHKVKTGDASRTLVGMAIASAANTWSSSPGHCLSWFNKRDIVLSVGLGNHSTTSPSPVAVGAEHHVLNWAHHPVDARILGQWSITTGTGNFFCVRSTGGTPVVHAHGQYVYTPGFVPSMCGGEQVVPEGLSSYGSALGAIAGGGTISSANTVLHVTTKG